MYFTDDTVLKDNRINLIPEVSEEDLLMNMIHVTEQFAETETELMQEELRFMKNGNEAVDASWKEKVRTSFRKLAEVLKTVINKLIIFVKSISSKIAGLLEQTQAKWEKMGAEAKVKRLLASPGSYVFNKELFDSDFANRNYGSVNWADYKLESKMQLITGKLRTHFGDTKNILAGGLDDDEELSKAMDEITGTDDKNIKGSQLQDYLSDNLKKCGTNVLVLIKGASAGTLSKNVANLTRYLDSVSDAIKRSYTKANSDFNSAFASQDEERIKDNMEILKACRSGTATVGKLAARTSRIANAVVSNRVEIVSSFLSLWSRAKETKDDTEKKEKPKNTTEKPAKESANIIHDDSFVF